MWRNVTPSVALIAAANNYLLPLWMLGFGGWLLSVGRARKAGNAASTARPELAARSRSISD